ncbi:predicted protein [Nematostella vectensis]|uniref:MADF domain-containing protein n=1 Tax=Nematostella vectensis TaxID=45351 RepID=A7SSD7_NEMVE|nr:predicted protein [Nematostella vectensis]|eukprot:XP_001625487.1 predicted protein [Nematostella vectensis]
MAAEEQTVDYDFVLDSNIHVIQPDRGVRVRRWLSHEVEQLIDLFEERPCLWDVSNKEYYQKGNRQRAEEEIAEQMGITLNDVKSKIKSLRSQLGREIYKIRTSENYVPIWIFWHKLQFLADVMREGRKRDSMRVSMAIASPDRVPDIKRNDSPVEVDNKCEVVHLNEPIDEVIPTLTQAVHRPPKKRKPEETPPRELTPRPQNGNLQQSTPSSLATCIQQILKEQTPRAEQRDHTPQTDYRGAQCAFSVYISERLRKFDRRTRIIAEKRITDILFELEMETHHLEQQNWQTPS